MKNKLKFFLAFIAVLFTIPFFSEEVQAKKLDEILKYTIDINVNPDATLNMKYHIEWKVLDSTSEGPLEWVKIGIPNKHYVNYKVLSNNTIKKISYSSSGGSYIRLDLNRKYKKDEVVTMEFELNQDYMYEMNKLIQGETVYEFTPGWFDDIDVDNIVVRWNSDKVESHSAATVEGDYLVWRRSLKAGSKMNISVTYKNDAFSFNTSKTIEKSSYNNNRFIGIVFVGIIMLTLVIILKSAERYKNGSGFTSETKITRKRVEYYANCPSCSAPRDDGRENCQFCGRSMIKSEEIVEEKDVPEEIREKDTDGVYASYPGSDIYYRVHVTKTYVPSRGRSTGGHSGGCACACACACAGGGRAGCTTKDFYNTNLKLSQIEKKVR